MNVYRGEHNSKTWYQVTMNGKPFDHRPSLRLVFHSPDGFAWGYHGSGPAQLALAILLEEFGKHVAEYLYMQYKDEVVSILPNHDGATWMMDSSHVATWVNGKGELPVLSMSSRSGGAGVE